jgi:hypothetical protein
MAHEPRDGAVYSILHECIGDGERGDEGILSEQMKGPKCCFLFY